MIGGRAGLTCRRPGVSSFRYTTAERRDAGTGAADDPDDSDGRSRQATDDDGGLIGLVSTRRHQGAFLQLSSSPQRQTAPVLSNAANSSKHSSVLSLVTSPAGERRHDPVPLPFHARQVCKPLVSTFRSLTSGGGQRHKRRKTLLPEADALTPAELICPSRPMTLFASEPGKKSAAADVE